MEETKGNKPSYTPEQLDKKNYKELRQIAIELDLNPAGLKLPELKLLLGAAPTHTTVVDNAEGISKEELDRRYVEQKRVPKKTIYLDKDDKEFWKMREKNPDAFDDVNFADKNARSQHGFSKKVKCACGTKFKIERVHEVVRDGIKVMVVDKNPMDYKQCPKCKRTYYYHRPDKNREIHALPV